MNNKRDRFLAARWHINEGIFSHINDAIIFHTFSSSIQFSLFSVFSPHLLFSVTKSKNTRCKHGLKIFQSHARLFLLRYIHIYIHQYIHSYIHTYTHIRRKYLKSIFIYKILNNETALNLKEKFLKISDCPIIHQLRNSQTDLVLPFPKSQFKKKTFSYSGATLWNNLSITAKQSNSMSCFKRLMKLHFH